MKHSLFFCLAAASLSVAAFSAHAEAPDAAVLEQGKTLFTSKAVPACAVCHTLADAGSAGAIGPNLDELKPTADQIKAALRDGVGVMPSFANSLSEADMDAVTTYVVHATSGK